MKSETIRSVDRVFEILEFMDSEERPLSLPEIVDWLGIPASSTAVLLRSMVALGFLQHDRSSRRYSPTIRLAHLGAWAGPYSLPDRRFLVAMRDIQKQTDQLVFLGHQNNIRVQYIHIESGEHDGEIVPKVGVMRLLVHSGLGLALMSLLNDNANRSIIRRINSILPDSENVASSVVESAINECRSVGFGVSEHTLRLGHGTLGVPVIVGGRQLAVGIGARVTTLHQSSAVFVRKLTETLQEHMGPDIIFPLSTAR